jgi:hypothetical protein
MKISMSQAVRETGIPRTTLWRAIKSGKMSAARTENGEWELDPAELFRAFPPKQENKSPATETGQSTIHHPSSTELTVENEGLKRLIETHQAEIERQEFTIADLRSRLDSSEQERREATNTLRGLLTHTSQPKKSSSVVWIAIGVSLAMAFAVVAYWKTHS